jgi:hypothetical protein
MARPIPINSAGLQHRNHTNAASFAPIRQGAHQVRDEGEDLVPNNGASFVQRVLFLLSGLIGSLVVTSVLGLWPELSPTSLGLGDRGAFCLLVSGTYLVATSLYAALKTRMLADVDQAPWDARLMAYANIALGGSIALGFGMIVFAMLAIVVSLVWMGAFLLSRSRD